MSRFPLWCLLAASCTSDAHVASPDVVGLGLTAPIFVMTETCDRALLRDPQCHDSDVGLAAARSNNDVATFMGIESDAALFLADQLGTADIEIETMNHGEFGATFEVVDIDHQSLIGCPPTYGPCPRPAHFTGTEAMLNPVFYNLDGDRPQKLAGHAHYAVEGVEAVIVENDRRLHVATGDVAGTATIYSSTGGEDHLDIVGADQIASFAMYTTDLVSTPVVLGTYPLHLKLRAKLADGREIEGATHEMPTIESDSIQIEASATVLGENYVVVKRVGRGHATLTIRWGSAVATLGVTDPSL